jgi:hypothetical protein
VGVVVVLFLLILPHPTLQRVHLQDYGEFIYMGGGCAMLLKSHEKVNYIHMHRSGLRNPNPCKFYRMIMNTSNQMYR